MPLSFNGKDEKKMMTYNLSTLLNCNSSGKVQIVGQNQNKICMTKFSRGTKTKILSDADWQL